MIKKKKNTQQTRNKRQLHDTDKEDLHNTPANIIGRMTKCFAPKISKIVMSAFTISIPIVLEVLYRVIR